MDSQIAGIAALYVVIELVKWFWGESKKMDIDRMIKDLWVWHSQKDEDGRPLWYVPRSIHDEQEKMAEMLRSISQNQETTARILAEVVKSIDDLSRDGIKCKNFRD